MVSFFTNVQLKKLKLFNHHLSSCTIHLQVGLLTSHMLYHIGHHLCIHVVFDSHLPPCSKHFLFLFCLLSLDLLNTCMKELKKNSNNNQKSLLFVSYTFFKCSMYFFFAILCPRAISKAIKLLLPE